MHSGIVVYLLILGLVTIDQTLGKPEESMNLDSEEGILDETQLEELMKEILNDVEVLGKRDDFSRILRGPSTFSRILRSPNTFSRILRSPSTFSRILRSSFSRIHRDPTTFSRILREQPDPNQLKRESFSRILRTPGFNRISKSNPHSRIL
ncbi:uncharacterized protein LOC131877555 [Tigriopus californicus]|nr:uncharacterized protein LOC131877555 [Tigriopus californicus]